MLCNYVLMEKPRMGFLNENKLYVLGVSYGLKYSLNYLGY